MITARTHPTILVVDDDAPIRALAAQVLESRGYEVLAAPNSQTALRMSEEHPNAIHLLLTDIMMPQGNGIALAQAFAAKRPETPVMYMSGFEAETIQLVQNDKAPEGEFLQKPFTPRTLLERVEAVVPIAQLEQSLLPQADTSRLPGSAMSDSAARAQSSEAVYRLESPAKCPECGETINTVKAIRLLRTQVNFISTLPRRGRVAVCPNCSAILPAELTNF